MFWFKKRVQTDDLKKTRLKKKRRSKLYISGKRPRKTVNKEKKCIAVNREKWKGEDGNC